jgi:cell division protein ZapA
MTPRKHTTSVSILGETYTLRTEASPERTRAVAEHVDQLVRRLLESGAVVETHRAAILAALQITDELFTARGELSEVSRGVRELSDEVRRFLPPPLRAGELGGD